MVISGLPFQAGPFFFASRLNFVGIQNKLLELWAIF